jgi:hypothetical protein
MRANQRVPGVLVTGKKDGRAIRVPGGIVTPGGRVMPGGREVLDEAVGILVLETETADSAGQH